MFFLAFHHRFQTSLQSVNGKLKSNVQISSLKLTDARTMVWSWTNMVVKQVSPPVTDKTESISMSAPENECPERNR